MGAASILAILMMAGLPVSALANPKLDQWKHVPGVNKIDGYLLQGIELTKSVGVPLKQSLAAYPFVTTENGQVVEIVLNDADPAVLKAIGLATDGIISDASAVGRVTAAVSSEQQLYALAALEGVRAIKPLGKAITRNGSVTGFGSESHFADLSPLLPNDLSRGAGVRIGLLSDSFATTEDVVDEDATDGIVTQITNSGTEVSLPLAAGVYTIVIQTPEANVQVEVNYSITGPLAPLSSCPATPISPLITFINSNSGVENRTTRALAASDGFSNPPALSCSSGAKGFAFYTFELTAAGSISVAGLPLAAAENVDVFLGIRRGCPTSDTTLVCQTPNISGVLRSSLPQQSGDLPSTVFILQDADSVLTDEGAAMAELVYDIAPGATQFFHTAAGGPGNFALGIRRLGGIQGVPRALINPVDVMVDDIGYPFSEPFYQTGLVAQAIREVVAERTDRRKLVTYFSAAGNDGDNSIRQVFNDVHPSDDESLLPSGNDLHRWPNGSGFLSIDMQPGASFQAVLHWNQPWASLATQGQVGAEIDLDMYVTLAPTVQGIRDTITIDGIAEGRLGRSPQGTTGIPNGDPIEIVSYTNNSTQPRTVWLAIDHFSGSQGSIPQIPNTPLEFTVLFVAKSEGVAVTGIDKPGTPYYGGVASYGHPNDPHAIAIGAVNYFDSPRFGSDSFETAEIDPEPFTSRGGSITTFFDSQSRPRVETAFKPDFAAADGNNTTFFGSSDFDLDGFPNFFGTSAAAPNAAAIAALLLDLKSGLTPGQIRAAFEDTALDVKGARAGAGRDDVSGAGFIKADAALEYVANNFGTDGGGTTPESVAFFFPNTEGWTFESPVPDFTAAGSSSVPGALRLTATNNTNTFGYWMSPGFAISGTEIPGFRTIRGKFGPGSLYRATYRVSSSTNAATKTPDFRFRVSSWNNEQTNELVVSSVGTGRISPVSGAPRFYRQYFNQPTNQNRFRVFFDLIAFRSPIEAGSTLSLTEVVIQALEEDQLLNSAFERLYLFSGTNSQGWRTGTSSQFAPNTTSVGSGLVLGPATDGNRINFSFWNSPEATPPFTLQRNRLYRVTWQLTSNAPANAKLDVPTFRLRANDMTHSMSALIQIDPQSESANVPFQGTAVNYKLFFEAPDELIGQGVILAFDQLYIPGLGMNPATQVRLSSVRVDSFSAPPQ
jgi:hypothetical protein